jgi:hypothetical protein
VAERQEQPARAGWWHVRALAVAEATLERNDPALAVYLARYASFQGRHGEAAKAEVLFARAAAIVDHCRRDCEGARLVVLEGMAVHLAAQGRSRELARVRTTISAIEAKGHERLAAPLAPPPGFSAESHAFGAWVP